MVQRQKIRGRDVAGSMSAVSGTVKALCGAGVAIAVSVGVVTSEQLCSRSLRLTVSLRLDHCISRKKIYNTYDTRRLPYEWDYCRVDNGFDQPSD